MDVDSITHVMAMEEAQQYLPISPQATLRQLLETTLPAPLFALFGSGLSLSPDAPTVTNAAELSRVPLPTKEDLKLITGTRLLEGSREGMRSIQLGAARLPLGIKTVWDEMHRARDLQLDLRRALE